MTQAEPDDQELLAAEYVLGTLDAEERARARALVAMDPGFAAIVRAWRIMPRLGVVPPSSRSPHNSTRCAPAAFAALTPATESTQIS